MQQIDLYQGLIAGYPSMVKGKATAKLWAATGLIHLAAADNLFNYTISTSGGESGAPVIINYNQGYCAVGIHCAGKSEQNHARAINTELYQKILSY